MSFAGVVGPVSSSSRSSLTATRRSALLCVLTCAFEFPRGRPPNAFGVAKEAVPDCDAGIGGCALEAALDPDATLETPETADTEDAELCLVRVG